jgi:hypothetical protein
VCARQGLYVNPTPSEAQNSVGLYKIKITADRLTCSFADLEITSHCLLRILQRCDPGIDVDELLFDLYGTLAETDPDGIDFELAVHPGVFRIELKQGIDPAGRVHLFARAVTFLHADRIED